MEFCLKKVCNEEDIKLVSDVAATVWNEHYKSILSKEQIDYMTDKFQSADAIKNQIENDGYMYYLIVSSGVSGYVGYKKEATALFLSKLYILKEKRGFGLARKTFDFIFDVAKENKLKSIYLTVNRNNLSSIEVYKKLGFKIIREEKADIGNGFFMDDYIMEYNREADYV